MTDINEFLLNKLDKLDEKLDHIKEDQAETRIALQNHEKRDEAMCDNVNKMGTELVIQSKLLSEYNDSLREHMRRTKMLEDKVEPMHREWSDRQVIVNHKTNVWKKVVTVIGVITAIAGAIAAIKK